MDFRQIKTGLDNITPITEDTIEKIACIKAFDNTELNNKLYEYHKQLLRYSKNKNKHWEVGFFWKYDAAYNEKSQFIIKGDINSISLYNNEEIITLLKTSKPLSIVMMHNHPRNGLFSDIDIGTFIAHESLGLMTAVCNDGTIYMIKKKDNFSQYALMQYYNEGIELAINNRQLNSQYSAIKYVGKHAKEIGITYRCSVKRK